MRRRALVLIGLAAALVLGGTLSAVAYWSASGTGSAVAGVTTLAAPSITSTSTGAGTVSLNWSSVAAPASGGGVTYYVTRDGGAPGGTCPTSNAPTSATSCTDSGVSVGTHTYTVTAVWRTWTAASASASATVTYGPVSQLVFTTQPAGATAGSAFTTQPVVTAEDALGHTVPTYTGTVVLSIKSGTGTSGAVLKSCAGVRSGGVTSFSGCEIDTSGTGYVLHASDGTRAVDSAVFNVSAGPLAALAFTTQPGGTITGGVAFPTQPVVSAQDAYGNSVPTFAGTVTLSITSGTGTAGATLSGCSGSLAAGVTSFSGCKIDKLGSAYKLHASASGLTADSTAFDVLAGPAASFTLTPGSTTVVAGVADNLTIKAFDAGGNLATGYTGAHSLTFSGASASPSGTQPTVTNSAGTAVAFGTATSISFASGQATVSGSSNGAMVLHKAETAHIAVTDGTVSTTSSVAVTVTTGSAAKLAWTHVSNSAGTLSTPCLFTCTVTTIGNNATFTANVSVTDADGNTVSGLGATHAVTVATNGGSFTAPTQSTTSVTLTIPATGTADSTQAFTLKTQTGNWTSDALTASSSGYANATATLSKN